MATTNKFLRPAPTTTVAPPVDPAALEAFAAGADRPAPGVTAPRIPAKLPAKKMSVFLQIPLWEKLRVYCIEEGTTGQRLVVDLLKAHLKQHEASSD